MTTTIPKHVAAESSHTSDAAQPTPSSSRPPSPSSAPYTPTSISVSQRNRIVDTQEEVHAESSSHGGDMDDTVVDISGQRDAPDLPEGDAKLEERGKDTGRRESGLPSPPLTRIGTNESTEPARPPPPPKSVEPPEADVTDWQDPLSAMPDETMVDAAGVSFAPGLDEDMDEGFGEKPSSPTRRGAPFRIDLRPPSPQPWDLVDPPPTNNNHDDLYSTAQTKRHRKSRPAIPHSSYYNGPPPADSAYGTQPVGQIGKHHPREIIRVERDYTGGEIVQFSSTYVLELEGRITPTQFLETINAINELLYSAYSVRHSCIENLLAVFTLQISRLLITTHYEKEMRRLEQVIDHLNVQYYNPVGLNILWPKRVAFLFLEIEYY